MNSRARAKEWPFPRHKHFSLGLRNVAANWFREHGLATHPKMPYCLPSWERWKDNIILLEVAEHVECERRNATAGNPFPLHKYLHHGMSSQAMLFNLVGPLMKREDLAPLCAVLASKRVNGADQIAAAEFEYVDRDVFAEDAGQPTSIDLVLEDSCQRPLVFVECKFDEQEFGGCSVFRDGDCSGKNPIGDLDSCFLHFIGRKYWPLMAKHGLSEAFKHDHLCPFAAYYQYFREILLALEKGGTFVLLSDERSPVFRCRVGAREKGLMPFLTALLPSHVRPRVVSVSVQEVVRAIEIRAAHHDWIFKFERKYGLA